MAGLQIDLFCAACPHEDVTPSQVPGLLISAATGARVEHGGCWTSSPPSQPTSSVLPPPTMGCTRRTLNVKVTGRGRGRKRQK